MTTGQFWMVHAIGGGPPTKPHAEKFSALTEAKRLARANPGVEFAVLEAVAIAFKQDVELRTLRPARTASDFGAVVHRNAGPDDPDIPF